MTKDLQLVSVKLPASDLRRIRGNRSDFVRRAVAEKLARETRPGWKPKTGMGRRLLRLRQRYLAEGGTLLDSKEFAQELRERRGGIA
jgi:Arc/MetJ-type ribon-helix-helix transcriptional regulator